MKKQRQDRQPFSTKYFTWLHVPKTGGTWLFRLFRKLSPPGWEATAPEPAHVLVADLHHVLPAGRLGLPVIAATRNPWDWYVSLYFFMEQHYRNGTGGFSVPRAEWPAGCRQWAERFSKGNTIEGFRESLPLLIEAMSFDSNYAVARPQEHFIRDGRGPLRIRVTRFENLREETLRAIEGTGAPVSPDLRKALLESPPTNVSGHCHYSHCYTSELRDLVDRTNRWLIRQVGYRFEQER
jgi:hypothetical protein